LASSPSPNSTELEPLEETTRQERTTLNDWDMDVDIGNWVPHTRCSRARDTTYLKAIYLYWHIQNFLGQIILDSDDEREFMHEQIQEM